jgi:hypothetical protein
VTMAFTGAGCAVGAVVTTVVAAWNYHDVRAESTGASVSGDGADMGTEERPPPLAGRERIVSIKTWCRKVGARLDQMTYDQKRTALDALGVQVRVWKSSHDPRYLITAGVPLDPPGQMGQTSHLYAASQNIHS